MVRRCVIEGCESKSSVPEHQGVTFHSFPFDSKTREIWIENCRIPADKNITKNILVCSRHFRRADFQPIKNGKFLLKSGSTPNVFPWKKNESGSSSVASAPVSRVNSEVADEAATTSTIEATIAQIMAETAELNRAAGITPKDSKRKSSRSDESPMGSPQSMASPARIEVPIVFTPGVRLEVQEINGQWHSGKVVEVDNDDREVLIKFEKSGKSKRAESEEWIPMNSPRLRQKASAKPPPQFETDEKCFARWTGSRKFPATVQKVLGDDLYEVLFEDGFLKTVRGNHMGKIKPLPVKMSPPIPVAAKVTKSLKSPDKTDISDQAESPVATADDTPKTTKTKKIPRKDWPLISMDTLDLPSLNLPEVPQDGEWTCHWVNDQPIGREGFLLIGEHKKPTVIVDDWRLPPNWVKHMYQRSNVLGKWDVILVNPAGKRFRSKADLKQALEDAGQVYNPDIYDFSIHRRRAKDINAYVYTPDYKPPPKPITTSLASPTTTPSSTTVDLSKTSVIETPIATPVPPMELMTPPPAPKPTEVSIKDQETKPECITAEKLVPPVIEPLEDGYALIGGLKVEIIDNLFRCPQTGCSKNFRKENHLQIHVKHYHPDLNKLLGECPNMQDLALKRTIGHPEGEPQPKNQIPNQQFFAKMHQIDLQTRSHRKSSASIAANLSAMASPVHQTAPDDIPPLPTVLADESINLSSIQANSTLDSSVLESDVSLVTGDSVAKMEVTDADVLPTVGDPVAVSTPITASAEPVPEVPILPPAPKKSKISVTKKASNPGARKSNRQRTTKKYLTATQPAAAVVPPTPPVLASSFDSSFGGTDFEETRHSHTAATPDNTIATPITTPIVAAKKLKPTPVSTNEPTITADSSLTGSCFMEPVETPQYIKENGELIKIVRMKQEEIINCLCNYGEEDGLMIQCELCLCWQHGTCNGIEKESDVPDKYICVICSNPQCGRESRKYIHDQDWMYEGKLPAANYHEENPMHPERFEILKKSHTLSGNLVELKRFLHSLQVKINIAGNKDHPKMYLWEKRWDPVAKDIVKTEMGTIKLEDGDVEMKDVSKVPATPTEAQQQIKIEPNIPQPEAPIDPVECQHRLLEHIKVQQNLVLSRLDDIEAQVNELEAADNLPDMKSAEIGETKDVLAAFIKELDTMKNIAKINALVHKKRQQIHLE